MPIKKSGLQFDKWGYAKAQFKDLSYGQRFMPGDALTNDDAGFEAIKMQGNGYPDYGSITGFNRLTINVEPTETILIHRSNI